MCASRSDPMRSSAEQNLPAAPTNVPCGHESPMHEHGTLAGQCSESVM